MWSHLFRIGFITPGLYQLTCSHVHIQMEFICCCNNQPNFYRISGYIYLLVSSFVLFSFHWSPSLVTINWQTSYDRGILRQDYGIMRDNISHHQATNLVRLRYLSSRLQNHTSRLRNHTSRLQNHTSGLRNHTSRLRNHTSRLRNHTSRLQNHTSRLQNHLSRLQNHTSRLWNHTSRLQNHTSRLRNHTSRLQNHTSRLRNHTSRLRNHTSRLQNHTSRLQNHTSRLQNHKSRLQNHTSRLRNHTRFAVWITIWVVHLPWRNETGLITASDQTVRVVLRYYYDIYVFPNFFRMT